jgi:hypothetical protein
MNARLDLQDRARVRKRHSVALNLERKHCPAIVSIAAPSPPI